MISKPGFLPIYLLRQTCLATSKVKYTQALTYTLVFIMFGCFANAMPAKKMVNGGDIKFERRDMGGKASVLMPTIFYEQKEEDMALRFPSNRKPVSLYSNLAKTVDLSLNVSNTVWDEKDIDLLLSFYKANIKGLYTRVVFTTEEVQKINKRKFAVFEFTCETVDKETGKAPMRKYIYIQYTVLGGKVMVLHLDCPIGEQSIWKPIAPKIMKSLKIKG